MAFIASASIGALTSLPRLIAAIGHAPNASPTTEVLSGIDLVAVLVFALLYRADVKAQDLQIARLSREETLAGLKIELSNKKVLALEQTRGVARLVIVAGTSSHIEEACRRSQPYFLPLLERGVVVVYFATDGQVPNLEFSADVPLRPQEQNENKEENLDSVNKEEVRVEKLWRGRPIYTSEWFRQALIFFLLFVQVLNPYASYKLLFFSLIGASSLLFLIVANICAHSVFSP